MARPIPYPRFSALLTSESTVPTTIAGLCMSSPPLPLRLARPAHHHMQRDLAVQPEVRQPLPGLARDLLHQAALRQRIHQPPRHAVTIRTVQPPPQPGQDHACLAGPGRRPHDRRQPVACDPRLVPVRGVPGRRTEELSKFLHHALFTS